MGCLPSPGQRQINQACRNENKEVCLNGVEARRGAELITHPQAKPKQPGIPFVSFSFHKLNCLSLVSAVWLEEKTKKDILTVLYKHEAVSITFLLLN